MAQIDIHDLTHGVHNNTDGDLIYIQHNDTRFTGVFQRWFSHTLADVHNREDLSAQV